jgi:hypothetical protein
MSEDGFEQAVFFALRCAEPCFQPVAECHGFIHLGDDSVLFGEGWERDRETA